MIQEVVLLDVIPGMETDFLTAFERAQRFIQGVDGYRSHSLSRCIEQPSRFLLCVFWDSVDSHEIGFRQSAAYTGWKDALHRFYEPFPKVEHFDIPIFSTS